MDMQSSSDADRLQMAGAGTLIVAIAVDTFSGYPLKEPIVSSAGMRLPATLTKSIESYINELVYAEADATGGDVRGLDKRLEHKLSAWLSGHSGLKAIMPLVSVTVVESSG